MVVLQATTTTSAQVAVPPPSALRGKTMEEIVNRWTSELETHVKDFSKFAQEVVVWDRALIENGNNVRLSYSNSAQNEADESFGSNSLLLCTLMSLRLSASKLRLIKPWTTSNNSSKTCFQPLMRTKKSPARFLAARAEAFVLWTLALRIQSVTRSEHSIEPSTPPVC